MITRGMPRSDNNKRRGRSLGDNSSRMAELDLSQMEEPKSFEAALDTGRTTESGSDSTSKLTRREQVQRIREQKRREEQENLTFKPAVPARRGRDTTVDGGKVNRFDRLYGEAKSRKEKVTVPSDTPTFKPTITQLGQSKKRSQTPEGVSKILYNTARAKKDADQPTPTFKPQISKRGKSLDRNRDVSPSTRLYAQAEITKLKLAKKAEEKALSETKGCTFTPQTNSSKNGAVATPTKEDSDVTLRMQKYMLLKEKKLEQLRLAKEAEVSQVATFKPATYTSNRRSLSRERNAEHGDVFNRLHSIATARRLSGEVEVVDTECTFRPALVAAQPVSPSGDDGEHYGSAHERLYFKGRQRQLALEQEKEDIRRELEKELTFTPQVTHTLRSEADSSKGPVFERLSASRQYVQEILSQIKSEFDLEECTFHPHINPTSEAIARNTTAGPVYDRLASEAEKTRQENEKRRLALLEEEKQQCTFTPHLSKAFKQQQYQSSGCRDSDVFDRLSDTPTAVVKVRKEDISSVTESIHGQHTTPVANGSRRSRIPLSNSSSASPIPVGKTINGGRANGGKANGATPRGKDLSRSSSCENEALNGTVATPPTVTGGAGGNAILSVPSDADLLAGLENSLGDLHVNDSSAAQGNAVGGAGNDRNTEVDDGLDADSPPVEVMTENHIL